jgi:Ca2+-binding EF-hand superfamily protein
VWCHERSVRQALTRIIVGAYSPHKMAILAAEWTTVVFGSMLMLLIAGFCTMVDVILDKAEEKEEEAERQKWDRRTMTTAQKHKVGADSGLRREQSWGGAGVGRSPRTPAMDRMARERYEARLAAAQARAEAAEAAARAAEQASRGLDEVEMRQIFDELDSDSNGVLERSEVRMMATRLGLEIYDAEVDEALAEMSGYDSGAGEVTYESFASWFRELRGDVEDDGGSPSSRGSGISGRLRIQLLGQLIKGRTKKAEEESRGPDEAEMRQIFDELDSDNNGVLERSEVRTMATRLGLEISDSEVDDAMAEVSGYNSGAGEVTYESFASWFRELGADSSRGNGTSARIRIELLGQLIKGRKKKNVRGDGRREKEMTDTDSSFDQEAQEADQEAEASDLIHQMNRVPPTDAFEDV